MTSQAEGSRPRLYFLIPALNEAPNAVRLAHSLVAVNDRLASRFDTSFTIVDDGSTDGGCEDLVRLCPTLTMGVLKHPTNLGPGAAFATGFEYLGPQLRPGDWLLTLEADNTSAVELVEQMLVRSAEGYDVVLASPYMYGGGITNTSLIRVLLSAAANVFVKESLEIRGILTASSFFRLYRGCVISRLQRAFGPRIVESAGFGSMVELLMKMVFLEATISEVPMRLDASRRNGASKMKIVQTSLGYFGLYVHKRRWKRSAAQWRDQR